MMMRSAFVLGASDREQQGSQLAPSVDHVDTTATIGDAERMADLLADKFGKRSVELHVPRPRVGLLDCPVADKQD